MLTLIAFAVAITILIGVHEYGHYRTAVFCGVKVRRFGIATLPVQRPEPGATLGQRIFYMLARPVWEWQPKRQFPNQETVFAIGLFPLAGYVQMMGQGDDDKIEEAERPFSFKEKPVRSRFAIVAAGPIANLLLAIALYAAVHWIGMQEPQPVLSAPVAGSIAEAAGLRGGERVEQAAFDGEPLQGIVSFEEVRWLLTKGALDNRDVRLALAGGRQVTLALSRIESESVDAAMFRRIGLLGPWTRPEVVEVVPGGAAAQAGLRAGDVVLSIGGAAIVDGQQLFEGIRASVRGNQPLTQVWKVQREGRAVALDVTPAVVSEGGAVFGRIGARVGAVPAHVEVHYGPIEGLQRGVVRTWEMSVITLRMIGRMVIGQASLKNLSGPVTIADFAGKSASLGLNQYLLYLAVISVSLGVLNLLPIPLLDGGHLMYYLWEAATGRSVSDLWMERLQRGGLLVLLAMMSIALFNDGTRYIPRLFG